MSKKWKQRSSYLLILSLLSTLLMVAPVAAAEPVAYVNTSPFVDVSTNHWAISNIIQMNLRNVVTGYTDGTFLPDTPVRQIEAVLMAVRSMGETEAIKATDSSRQLAVTVPDWVLESYKRELLFAVDQGLIVPSEGNFNADTYASRAWVAQLIVRMVGKDKEAQANSNENTKFKDNQTIPIWALPYVSVAVQYEIIQGYPDNTFQPNNNVTRAEIVTLLTRTEKMLPALQDLIISGTITNISDSQFTISIRGSSMKFNMQTTTWGFDTSGKVQSWTKLQVGDHIKLLLSGNNALCVQQLKELDYEQPETSEVAASKIKGTIRSVVAADNLLIYQAPAGILVTEQLGPSVKLTNMNGNPIVITQLPVGAEIEVSYNSNKAIIAVKLLSAAGSYGGDGYIHSIDTTKQLIIIKDANDVFTTYEYDDDLQVKISGLRIASLSDLRVGDMVALTVKNNRVTDIELVEAQQNLNLSGEIVSITPSRKLISVESDSGLASYYLSDSATIIITGLSAASINDLVVGDKITASVKLGLITQLEVLNRNANSNFSGTIVALDTKGMIIVIKVANGNNISYDLSSNVRVYQDSTTYTLSDLSIDMEVDLTVVDDKVLYIELSSGEEGTVTSINTGRRLLTIQSRTGKTASYVYNSDVAVSMATVSNADDFDIKVGDTIKVYLNSSGIVTSIDVQCSATYEVLSITKNSNRLKVRDENGKETNIYLDGRNLTIQIPGIRNPGIDNFNVGDIIQVTFMGTAERSIVVMEKVSGRVSSLNEVSGNFTVVDYSGANHNYTFTRNSVIKDGSKTYTRLNSIAVNDRVHVYEKMSGDVEITLMSMVTGEISSISNNYDELYIKKTGSSSYERYYLAADCKLYENGKELTWRNLKLNDRVRLYMVDNNVYEVERY